LVGALNAHEGREADEDSEDEWVGSKPVGLNLYVYLPF
jgi:hypothetical protein